MKRIRYVLFIGLIAGSFACNQLFDDFEHAKVDFVTEFGLQVADIRFYIDSSLNIGMDTLIDGFSKPEIELYPGEDGILRLHIVQKLTTVRLDDFLRLSDTVFMDTIGFPALQGFFIEGSTRFGFQLVTFDKERFAGKSVDSIRLDEGTLSVQFNTYGQFQSEFGLSFPGIVDESNEALEIRNFVPTEEQHEISIDLRDHTIKVDKKGEKEYFIIDLDYYLESLDETTDAEPEVVVMLKDLDLDYAYGSLGYDSIPEFGEQKIALPGKLWKDQDVSFDFEKPEIKLRTLNSFALPFRYDVNSFLLHFPDDRTEAITGLPDNLYIDAPAPESTGGYESSTIALDPSTNFDVLLAEGPSLLTLDGILWTNPSEPDLKNYLRDQDSLSAILDLDIPFSMHISEIVLRDTIQKAIFDALYQPSYDAETIIIKTDISNSFPFDLRLQSYFFDESDHIIDSLFTNPVLITGPGADLKATKTSVNVEKDRMQIERLYATDKTVTVARFKTSDAEEEKIVSFRDDQKLDVKLTVFARLNIQSVNE